jgi:hypothetical protein
MKPLILTIALLLSTPAWAEEVLYCQSELATGLIKENGRWKQGSFKLKRFTVKFNDDYSVISGLPFGDMLCKNPYNVSITPAIVCNIDSSGYTVGITFNYNPTNKRFIYTSVAVGGYIDNSKNSDTDSIYAGTCQQF